jgi:hypothetical protein
MGKGFFVSVTEDYICQPEALQFKAFLHHCSLLEIVSMADRCAPDSLRFTLTNDRFLF